MKELKSVREILAENVQKYRKLNHFTQAQLAEKADLSNTYIANIECGKTWISDVTLEKIAGALNTEIYLFFVQSNNHKLENNVITNEEKVIFINEKKAELSKTVIDFFNDFISQYKTKFEN